MASFTEWSNKGNMAIMIGYHKLTPLNICPCNAHMLYSFDLFFFYPTLRMLLAVLAKTVKKGMTHTLELSLPLLYIYEHINAQFIFLAHFLEMMSFCYCYHYECCDYLWNKRNYTKPFGFLFGPNNLFISFGKKGKQAFCFNISHCILAYIPKTAIWHLNKS